jgi:hypothetical protein
MGMRGGARVVRLAGGGFRCGRNYCMKMGGAAPHFEDYERKRWPI